METQDTTAGQQQYLSFYLAGEEYAISILRIKEIIEYGQVTKVPRMPAWIQGVINLRGSVVPVIDLAVKLGLPETKITRLCCIIMVELELEGEPLLMGVIAESVSQVVDLSPDDIQAPPAFGTRLRADYLIGMGNTGSRFALILDIDRILSIDELLVTAASADVLEESSPEIPAGATAAADDSAVSAG